MRNKELGFTLIELMITVAVVALLAAIAYPSYRNQIMRSNRTEAKIALLSAAQSLEKCYTTANTYVGCTPSVLGNTPNGKYTVAAGAGGITATTFDLVATPLGGQADDTDCATFRIRSTGQQTAANSSSTDTSAQCWR